MRVRVFFMISPISLKPTYSLCAHNQNTRERIVQKILQHIHRDSMLPDRVDFVIYCTSSIFSAGSIPLLIIYNSGFSHYCFV
uniref:Uncharacterized protein n=1 Tax=Anopheles darlingi TaxID=43151 RepID=A0A2M4DGF1_ANODA